MPHPQEGLIKTTVRILNVEKLAKGKLEALIASIAEVRLLDISSPASPMCMKSWPQRVAVL